MYLGDHLLYIDVTNVCPYHCAFCMYSEVHSPSSTSLRLDPEARSNLGLLVNLPRIYRVSISGEGEPLINAPTILEILSLSEGGRRFELITSGFMDKALARLVAKASNILSEKGDALNIRISLDSYHAAESDSKQLGRLLDFLLELACSSAPITVSFRSVECDRPAVRLLLTELLEDRKGTPDFIEVSPLEDAVILPSAPALQITYKNMVYPGRVGRSDAMALADYVGLMESLYDKPFTFGHLSTPNYEKGLDITVKPNGDVLFYGIETMAHANIFQNSVDEPFLCDLVENDPYVSVFYRMPLSQILTEIQALNPEAATLIADVNNPYWIVKELYTQYRTELDAIIVQHRLARLAHE
jgi:hypothetical protein